MGLSPIVLLLTLHNTMGVSEKETEPTRQWFPIYDDQNQLFQSPFGDYALEYWLAKAHFTIWFQLRRKQVESLEDLRNFSRRRLRILPSKVTSLNHEENDLEKGDEPQSIVIPIRRSTRTRRPTDRMCLYIDAEEHELGDLGEPANYKATLLDPESDKWLNAMNVEMQSMKDNEPRTMTMRFGKWMSKLPSSMDILMKRFTWRNLKVLSIQNIQTDQNADEPCVYLKATGSNVTFLILYADDILIMGNSIPMLQDVKSYLGRCFAMKDLGEAAYILRIKIYRDRLRRLIGLCQSAYIEKILKRFHIENSKRGKSPWQDKN
ncbi:retrotransposon protein, putative, ty1-copia subclass [Tanacetum coccineum]